MAPEIIKNCEYDHSIDYWACGVVLFEMLNGTTPFENFAINEIDKAICEYDIELSSEIPEEAIHMIKGKNQKNVTDDYSTLNDHFCGGHL